MKQFEDETPRAPQQVSPALEGLVQPAERSPAFAGLAGQQPRQTFLQRIFGPVYQGPSLADRLFGDTSIYQGPSILDRAFAGGTSAPTTGLTQDGLTAPTATALTSLDMFALNADPYKPSRGKVAFGALMSALSHGVLPPFISFAGQAYLGLPDELLGENYVKGANGWIKVERGQVAATGGGDGGGGGRQVVYIPRSGGGGSARTNRSGLVNWRI